MFNSLINCLYLLYILLNVFHLITTEVSKADVDKQANEHDLTNVKQACCPKDYDVGVMTRWDHCYTKKDVYNIYQYSPQEPLFVCRKALFQLNAPCNKGRKSKCGLEKKPLKGDWIKCISEAVRKNFKGLQAWVTKDKAKQDAKVKAAPGLKMQCFATSMVGVQC